MHQGRKLSRFVKIKRGVSLGHTFYNNSASVFFPKKIEIPPPSTIRHKIVLSNQMNTLIMPWICLASPFAIIKLFLSVSSYHVTYVFQSESALYSCLNVKKTLARSRLEILSLSDYNWTRTHNHLVRKRTLI